MQEWPSQGLKHRIEQNGHQSKTQKGGRPSGRPPTYVILWTLPLREVAPARDATKVISTCYR